MVVGPAGNRRCWGSGRPRRLPKPFQKVRGCASPWNGFWGCGGCPDPKSRRLPCMKNPSVAPLFAAALQPNKTLATRILADTNLGPQLLRHGRPLLCAATEYKPKSSAQECLMVLPEDFSAPAAPPQGGFRPSEPAIEQPPRQQNTALSRASAVLELLASWSRAGSLAKPLIC
jgi:hypothetical protein